MQNWENFTRKVRYYVSKILALVTNGYNEVSNEYVPRRNTRDSGSRSLPDQIFVVRTCAATSVSKNGLKQSLKPSCLLVRLLLKKIFVSWNLKSNTHAIFCVTAFVRFWETCHFDDRLGCCRRNLPTTRDVRSFGSWGCVVLGCLDVWLVQLQCLPLDFMKFVDT